MLTLFSTAKPFRGHSATIQRNELKSWKCLHREVEIIMFGDDEGVAEVCAEFGMRLEPHVERYEFGTNRVDYMFTRTQEIARHDTLCFVNCDFIILPDFFQAIERVRAAHSTFLAIGRRWNLKVKEPIDFSAADWGIRHEAGRLRRIDTSLHGSSISSRFRGVPLGGTCCLCWWAGLGGITGWAGRRLPLGT